MKPQKLRWMSGQIPQHPNKESTGKKHKKESSKMKGGSPTYTGVLNLINGVTDANPRYLHLHDDMMQAN